MLRNGSNALSLTSVHSVVRVLEPFFSALNNSLVEPLLEIQRGLLQLLEARVLRELTPFLKVRSLEVDHEIVTFVHFLPVLSAVT